MKGLFAALIGASDSTGEEGGYRPGPSDDFWYGEAEHSRGFVSRPVSAEFSMRVSTVYACVNLLAKTVAALPVAIYRNEARGASEALGNPLYTVLSREPNRWQTAFDFKAMMMMHLVLRGNAYAEIFPGPRGAVDRLEPIHPDRVTKVERLPDGSLRYRVAQDGKADRFILQDDMFHIRSPIAPSGLVGMSPITYARETLGLALSAEEHGVRMLNQGVRPSGVVTVPKRMSDAAFQRFKTEFGNAYGGVGNAGKTPILEDGAEFKPMKLTADDVQFLATRGFQIEEIARWFDVPLVLLHHMDKTTSWGTGVEAIMLAFVRNNLNPWLEAWTQAIRRDLILVPDVYFARFDVESLIRGDSKALADFIARLVLAGVLVRNEGREILGYNPLPGLDQPLSPVNMAKDAPSRGDNGGEASPSGTSAFLGHNGGPPLAAAEAEGVQS